MAKIKFQKGTVFQRTEKKYLLNAKQYNLLSEYLEEFMAPDEYGLHTISSIYYDTDDYKIIRHSLDKPSFKEKLRLRAYGTVGKNSTVFLEMKNKFNGITYKRRIPLLLSEAESYLRQNYLPYPNNQIAMEINWFISQNSVTPKVLLAYDRVALAGKSNDDLRITFDKNIRFRDYQLELNKGNHGSHILPLNNYLMEIKALEALPLGLSNKLSELKIYPSSFSKYGTVFSEHLLYRKEYRHVG